MGSVGLRPLVQRFGFGVAEFDIDWYGEGGVQMVESWMSEQSSRENTPAVGGQERTTKSTVRLVPSIFYLWVSQF